MEKICFIFLFLFFSRVSSDDFKDVNEHELLLSIKASIHDPLHYLSNWNNTFFCKWNGIRCNSNSTHVTQIDLSGKNLSGKISESFFHFLYIETIDISDNQLDGTIPRNVFSCSSLVHLNLSNNNLTGSVPKGSIPNLQKLDLSNNFLSGPIPDEIGFFSGLQYLDLGGNALVGKIPKSITNLTKLQDFTLASNQLVGELPKELGFMKSLKFIYLGYNNFSGQIPNEIGELTSLNHLNLAFNNLTGEIPLSIGNLTELNYLFLYFNKLNGSIPVTLFNLKKLLSLDVSDNLLSGEIPELVSEFRVLEVFHLFSNNFSGKIPKSISTLRHLQVLQLWSNKFSGEIPDDLGKYNNLTILDLSTNSLTGKIPENLCDSGHLQKLILFSNLLEGNIPVRLCHCFSLTRVRFQNNRLSGELSPEFVKLPLVYYLDLSANNFSGELNNSKWKMPKLQMLSLARNKFSGELPSSFGSNKLENLDLSENDFFASIPSGIGKFSELMELKLSHNRLSGKIPNEISSCKKLVSINFSCNRLIGEIPETLSRLPVLGNLDLSVNQLSGEIPKTLGNMESLVEVNISHNHFRGKLPSTGVFLAINSTAVTGNNLCGGASITNLPPCKENKNFNWWFFWTALACVTFAIISVLVLLYVKRRNVLVHEVKTRVESELDGGGEWEFVFFDRKASKFIAIDKILKSLREQTSVVQTKSMQFHVKELNEINVNNDTTVELKEIGKVRHPNIVKLVAIGRSEKGRLVLVHEHVEGRKLSEVIGVLSWEQRWKIAAGIAKALHYLHGCCSPESIVVGHVSSKNVIVVDGKDDACLQLSHSDITKCLVSSANVAPETKETKEITESSDIYGFGLILIELLSGKTLVDAEIGLHENIVEWARYCYSDCHIETWVDPLLKVHAMNNPNEFVEIMSLALQCTARDPAARPYAADVVKILESTTRSMEHTGWKLRRKQWTGTTDQLIEDLEAAYGFDFEFQIMHPICFRFEYSTLENFKAIQAECMSGRVDIFDMVDIDLFTVIALNMMVLKLGYTGKSEPMFYNYLRSLTSLDEGLYVLACEEDVRCLATLVRSFKLIEVYIEHGVTALDSYLRAPRFRATLEEINDEPACSITSVVGEQGINAVKSSACWVWRPKIKCWLCTTQQMVINSPYLIDKKELAIPGQTPTGKE
ncbi:probably inactive leucine-rich repeat receptor-like protein kinase [Tanacetum coccineum]